VITELTTDFLKNRDASKPFFVMCQYKATHDPWASRPPYDTLWKNEYIIEPENLYDTYNERSEAAHRTTLKLELMNQGTFPHERLENASRDEQRGFIYQQYIKAFLRCGRVLDENIGKLIEFLRAEGLYDNTVIVYTADQGHFLGEHGFFSKRFIYEEAMRMPLIIRYPKIIKPGSLNEDLVANIDFMPTILELANIEIPQDVQGRSIVKLLKANTPDDWRQAIYYHYWQHILHRDVAAHYGIRTKNRKLIFYYGLPLGLTQYDPTPPEWEMFDLTRDPGEMKNVYSEEEYQSELNDLKKQLLSLQDQYDDRGNEYPQLKRVQQQYFW
jgi:arylsulfatase A-like enzyme